jgi:hypothetical protein
MLIMGTILMGRYANCDFILILLDPYDFHSQFYMPPEVFKMRAQNFLQFGLAQRCHADLIFANESWMDGRNEKSGKLDKHRGYVETLPLLRTSLPS